ncbi:MAG: hypothetical protein GY940_40165 [bacterium]|nr:hypothetical protein [bacterium]
MFKLENKKNPRHPVGFAQPPWGSLSFKPVQEVIRTGLEELLSAVLEKEIDEFIRTHRDYTGPGGLKEIVRNGYHKERAIQCKIGVIRIAVPRSRDRGRKGADKIIFQSRIIPRYMRRVDELDALIPALYLKGFLSGDFSGVFSLLLGEDDQQLLPVSDVEDLKAQWETGANNGENREWSYWNISGQYTDDWGYWNSGSLWGADSGSSIWRWSGVWINDWGNPGSGNCGANDPLTGGHCRGRHIRGNGNPQRIGNRKSRFGSVTRSGNRNTNRKQSRQNNRKPYPLYGRIQWVKETLLPVNQRKKLQIPSESSDSFELRNKNACFFRIPSPLHTQHLIEI